MRKMQIAGLTLATIGILICISSYRWIENRKLQPLVAHMTLTKGHKIYAFTTDANFVYVLQLEFLKTGSWVDMACGLGVNLSDYRVYPSCGNKKAVLDLTWTLSSHGRLASHFSSNTNYLGGRLDSRTFIRSLGNFNGVSGTKYVLDIDIKSDERALSATAPILRIQVGSAYEEVLSVKFAIMLLLGVLCLVFGAATLVRRSKGIVPIQVMQLFAG